MADIKFSELPKATQSKDSDEIAILQDGVNKMIQSPVLESKIINKTVSRVIEQGGISLNLINPIDTVPTYADLALITPTPELNDAYQVEADGLVYVYTENGFQSDGDGFVVQAEPNGIVEEGNTDAVSGGEVYKSFLKKEVPELEFGGINLNTGALSDATTRVRNKGFINTSDIDLIKLTSPNLFIRNIVYYNNGVFVSQETAGLVNDITPTIPPTSNHFKIVLSKNPDTGVITQLEIDNSKMTVSYNTEYNLGLIDGLEPIKIDYDNAVIDLNTSENELGGILVNWGFNTENNIRIRSKDLISVKDGISHSFKNIKDGYVLNRIYRYKDGVYYNATSESPGTTFIPNHTVYNQIRAVWSKTNNTEIITNEELNDFSFNLVDDSLEYKITEIAKNTSKIPVLESVVDDIRYGKYKGKTLSILSDSMSTFTGYIPVGNSDFYPQGDVTSVTQTWWDIVLQKTGMTLEVNNSWSGSPIAGSSPQGFSSRIGNIGSPDVCLIFGGTNDYRLGINIGDWNYTNTTFDLLQFKQAIQNLLYNLITTYPLTKFIFMTPMHRNDTGEGRVNGFPVNWNNEKYLADYQDAIVEACVTYGVQCIDTREIFSYYNVSQYTIEGLHLNAKGMGILADLVVSELK